MKPSPYKKLSQTLLFPHTRITETINSIRGRFENIESPHLRFAPGLSLKYKGLLPDQTATFKDGDNPLFLYQLKSKNDAQFSKFTLPYIGYLLAMHPKHVLVIQHGGGSAIPCALASGADNITIVEQQPQIADRVRQHYKLPVINQNPRTFLARSDRRYDIIHIENWGTSLPGSAALTQDYFFTIESFTQYFQHLSNNGILIVSRLLLLPPSDAIRLWAAAYESLRSLEIKNPEKHIAVLRNWNTFTMIVSVQPFNDTTVIQDVSQNLNFDIVYLPGISKKNVNRFNIFDAPYHYIEINVLQKRTGWEQKKHILKTTHGCLSSDRQPSLPLPVFKVVPTESALQNDREQVLFFIHVRRNCRFRCFNRSIGDIHSSFDSSLFCHLKRNSKILLLPHAILFCRGFRFYVH